MYERVCMCAYVCSFEEEDSKDTTEYWIIKTLEVVCVCMLEVDKKHFGSHTSGPLHHLQMQYYWREDVMTINSSLTVVVLLFNFSSLSLSH